MTNPGPGKREEDSRKSGCCETGFSPKNSCSIQLLTERCHTDIAETPLASPEN